MKSFIRTLALALSLSLVLVFAVGCVNSLASEEDTADVAPTEEAADIPVEETAEEPEEAEATEAPATPEPDPEPVGEVVVVDNDDAYLSITEQGRADDGDYFWKLHIENKAKTATMFTMDAVSLDGLGANPDWGLAVDAGAKVDTAVYWDADTLTASGLGDMETVTTATFRLDVYDNEDWSVPSYFNELTTVYFVAEDAAKPFTYEPSENDSVVFDTEAATMVVTDLQVISETNGGEDGAAIADVVLVNNSDDSIRFEMPNTAINGYAFKSATMDATVPPHASFVTSFKWTFSMGYLQGLGILDGNNALIPGTVFTLNMKVSDVDDLTVPTIAEQGFDITR